MQVELRVNTPADPVVSGTPLPVHTTIRNVGTSPVDLPAPRTQSPLVFVVRDAAGQPVASGNGRDAMAARLGLPGPVPPPVSIPPGGEVGYDEDVAAYFGRPLDAGRYQLVAELREQGAVIASASGSLTVEDLAPEAVVRAASADATWLATLVAHRRPDGRRTVFHGFADTSGRGTNVLRPAMDLPSGDVATLAVVPRVFGDPSFAWAACLDGDTLSGVLVRPFDTAHAFGPVPLGIGAARLLERGAPLPDGGALLLVQSRSEPSIVVVRLSATGQANIHRVTTPAGLAAALPVVAVSTTNGTVRVWVCWTEGEHLVQALSFEANAPAGAVTGEVLRRTEGRIVALQADPPARDSAAHVTLVELPDRWDAPVVLTRLVPGDQHLQESGPIPTPPAGARGGRAWHLASSGVSANGPVLVGGDGTAWLLADGTWSPVQIPARARGVQLVRYGADDLWLATWSARGALALSRLASNAEPPP